MKHSTKLHLSGLLFLLFALGCSSNNPTDSGNNQPGDAEFSQTAEAVDAAVSMARSATTVYSMAQFVPGLAKVSATLSDTLLPGVLTCPYLIWDQESQVLTLEYGTDCEGADGRTRSGSIEVSYSGSLQSQAILTITYNNFSVDGVTYSGTLSMSANSNSFQLSIEDGKITDPEGTAILDGSLSIRAELNNRINPNDDVYFVGGSITVTSKEGDTISFETTQELRLDAICEYPTQGKLNLTVSGDFSGSGSVDFFPDNGACDDIIELTIGKFTRRISLGDL